MSVLCALAPSIALLTVTRTLQGLAGAAVAVVTMAVVRDLFSGIKAAQLLSRLMLGARRGADPGSVAGQRAARALTSWRGIFVVLALVAVGMLVLALVALPETLPVQRRRPASLRGSLRGYGALFSDRLFLVMVGVAGLMFATLFAYISGAPFVLQDLYGLSPQEFGLAFSANAVGLIAMTQINPLLVQAVLPGQRAVGRGGRGLRGGAHPAGADGDRSRRLARLLDPLAVISPRPGCRSRTPPPSRSAGTVRPPAPRPRCSAPRSS